MLESKTLVGQILGQDRYRVKKKLGEGGMAFVLLAFDKTVGNDVVIKLPKPEVLADPESAARFKREIRSMAALTHPNIVKIKDVGEQDGVPFYVMDLLPGGSLKDRFETVGDARKPQSPESLVDWLEPVARALDYSHQWFVHRDIKPDNILFDASGKPFVSDFGIVKAISARVDTKKQTVVTQAGFVIGTCSYIAPEVTEGKRFDGRADQYALAATVYEALSGRVPFDGDNLPAIIMQQLTAKVPPLNEVTPLLRDLITPILEKGLSRDPNDRYANCTEFSEAVLAAIQSSPAKNAPGVVKSQTGSKPVTKRRPRIVCPSCRKRLILPTTTVGTIICPACNEELTVTKKPVERETKTSSVSKAVTEIVRDRKAAPSPDPEEVGSSGDERRILQSHSYQKWIAIGAAAIFLGVIILAGVVRIFSHKSKEDTPSPSPEPPTRKTPSTLEKAQDDYANSIKDAERKLSQHFQQVMKDLSSKQNASLMKAVQAEYKRFSDKRMIPWSEPMWPYLQEYLVAIELAEHQLERSYDKEIDKARTARNETTVSKLQAELKKVSGVKVVARWNSRAGNNDYTTLDFYSNGKIFDRDGSATWSVERNSVLIMKWPKPNWVAVDTVNVSQDGMDYNGSNQRGLNINGSYFVE